MQEPAQEAASPDTRKVTWSYEKKVGRPNYGSETAAIFVTDRVPEDMTAMEVVFERSEQAFDLLRAKVNQALGE